MSQSMRRVLPRVVNRIIKEDSLQSAAYPLVIATRNESKLREFSRVLGVTVIGRNLHVSEIQSEDPIAVLEEKAKEAWRLNDGSPIIVEDSVFMGKGLDGLPGTFVDQFTNTFGKRQALCRMFDGKDRTVVFQTGVAIFDGEIVHYRLGRTSGQIAEEPIGTEGFGFDDIFIPDGQKGEKWTFAQMSDAEKDSYSPRKKALELLREEPFILTNPVYELPEPFAIQLHSLRIDKLKTNKAAVQFAYSLEQIKTKKPDSSFNATERKPYKKKLWANGEIQQFLTDENSASIGFLLTPWDINSDLYGNSKHVKVNDFGQPLFWQMGDNGTKLALVSRAYEFSLMHNDEMYTLIRTMMNGKMKTTSRPNKRSPAIERLLSIRRKIPSDTRGIDDVEILSTAATRELGYARMSSDRYMSRTKSANIGLLLNTTGVPSSLFALGGMPPVTGWRDVIVTAALSYMRAYIPRNSVFAGNFKRQLRLFEQAKLSIQMLKLPNDIEQVVLKQIGISVGCEDPQGIAKMAKIMQKAGCSSLRIYTTNPDPRTIETAESIRQAVGSDFTICIGPIVDVRQARKLIRPSIKTNILLAGHGGGENCTSLAGGGTANALELLYEMYLDPLFNKTAIGLEGGTGDEIGAFLGLLDVISLNRRGVAGGIETGGLFVEHVSGRAVQPYHGSASIVTQWIEAALKPEIACRRLNDAGRLRNVEGVLNYMNKHQSTHSIVEHFWERRMYAGRALADQGVHNLYELRAKIGKEGLNNHRSVTTTAAYIAAAHRVE
jgi:non-canonical purine NTP pyrophosphatase (RdgB/HAM1 family)